MENELEKEVEVKSTKKFYCFGIIAFILVIIALFIFWLPFAAIAIAFVAFIFGVLGVKDSRTKMISAASAIVAPIVLIACIVSTVHFYNGEGLIGKYRRLEAEDRALYVYAWAEKVAFDCAREGVTEYKGVTISEDGVHYIVTAKILEETNTLDNPFKSGKRSYSDFSDGGLTVDLEYNSSTDWKLGCKVTGTINGFDLIWMPNSFGFTAFKYSGK